MKTLLVVTAVVEMATGLALVLAPSGVASFLLGSPLDTPAALLVGRVAGVALLALGIACWLARRDEPGRAAAGLIAPMLLYNAGVVVFLGLALGGGLSGIGFWPAVLLHVVLATWCIACLRGKHVTPTAGATNAPSPRAEG
jgi:hypothetical protein